ncbi:hypothetical protein L6452_32985 [Arctium lappa]|uniref:Uncharacterized protein n=1 Tax=Arctium lappa TaxID=4217 RepID=A0ACB8Z664_ARCLA|nr:hypothetical protein L6452_32985 [Arctium lappa]
MQEDELECNTSPGMGKKVSGSKRKAKSFKDEDILKQPKSQKQPRLRIRLESSVLDLAADDSGGLQKQKSSYHWDKV